jgi:hypothetical protein
MTHRSGTTKALKPVSDTLMLVIVITGIPVVNIGVWLFLANRLVKLERAITAVIHTMGEIPEELATLLTTPRRGAHRG